MRGSVTFLLLVLAGSCMGFYDGDDSKVVNLESMDDVLAAEDVMWLVEFCEFQSYSTGICWRQICLSAQDISCQVEQISRLKNERSV